MAELRNDVRDVASLIGALGALLIAFVLAALWPVKQALSVNPMMLVSQRKT